ncbi:MAG: cysteine hydrolase [Ruminococcus sp.]|nr:cysteine hydrolase [Ruminococcus sp.]
MILLILDAQKLITNDKLYNFPVFESRVRQLISCARENGTEVIFVRHDDGENGPLKKGTEGFEIYNGFRPLENERIFDKTVNSPFRDTGLLEYLREKGEDTIMLAGLQTDYCMDAAVKAGFEHRFRMVIPEGTNSTFDNGFMSAADTCRYYNDFMWNRRYAECIPFDKALALLKE